MPLYMLDTDIASYIMNETSQSAMQRLVALPTSATCISAIVESELRYGITVSPRRQLDEKALDEFLAYMQVLDYSSAASREYGLIRGDLKLRGALIGANDMLIAAHARCLGLTLVTNNTREFNRVPGLKIENWA